MFKRVTANLFFTREDEGEDFYHDCEIAFGKAVTINPGQPNSEHSHIVIQECYHDQSPSIPCIVLDEATTP